MTRPLRHAKRRHAYRFGLAAEKSAAWFLRCKGYRILSLRYRNYYGEIDIIAMRGSTLIAVEVKARKSLEQCESSITAHKQQRVARALEGFLATTRKNTGLARIPSHNTSFENIRFDVVWIAPWRLPHHITDAWRI